MMGTKDRVFAAIPPVALAELVRSDHFYRRFEQSLDRGFVRDVVRDAYAESGRPLIDPIVFRKPQLILCLEHRGPPGLARAAARHRPEPPF
jgi:hypothetical protein